MNACIHAAKCTSCNAWFSSVHFCNPAEHLLWFFRALKPAGIIPNWLSKVTRNCSVPSQLRAASALESASLMGACSYIIYVFLRNMRYRIFLYWIVTIDLYYDQAMPVVMIKSGFPRCGVLQPPPFKAQKSTLTLLAKVLVFVCY